MRKHCRGLVLIVTIIAETMMVNGCGNPPKTCSDLFDRPLSVFHETLDDPANLDDYHDDLKLLNPSEWVEYFSPSRSFIGFNLVLYERRVPMLIDMNGHIAHVWPKVRAVGRARLDHCGRLAVIGRDNLLKEYDWNGNLRWFWQPPGDDFPHHDFIRLDNLNYLIVVRAVKHRTDYLVEVNRHGKVAWKWRSSDYLEEEFPTYDRTSNNPTHFNSVNELPPNPLFDEGDSRFRPGNILVSARNLNTIFIIDKKTRDVVWRFAEGLDFQHEAIMIPAGYSGAGNIVLFNNGYHNLAAFRQSSVTVIDPRDSSVEFDYRDPHFFSSVTGTAQPLPNGNFLITSSQGGRVFEVTPENELVWQWAPPFLPMRTLRYPTDHCPEFAALTISEPKAVASPDKLPHIDIELFSLTLPEEHQVVFFEGKQRRLLVGSRACSPLVMPEDPRMKIGYGLRREQLHEASGPVRFRVTLQPLDSDEALPEVLIDDIVEPNDDEVWRLLHLPITGHDRTRIELCLDAQGTGEMSRQLLEQIAVWESPTIISRKLRLYGPRPEHPSNEEEERIRNQQLRTLGYIQ